ncbi:hypothetical protein COCC4DRAFT_33284 [Bipolaris maydis ATCC 48331]|uniref:Uncharacterized protein n=2 Tax=Cochliobolus heterostrophus TaxID=5016 RepID=M2UW33_COCH5|nr:uncharacterized protein COCC4DRAFT_33284 [Bipolaris maydis ATCC 48331]EMD97761.1 hypothetical protein COCHEDRAFT_1019084 [Bipolaris maydis C5]ENI02844.1 hypothetical protein COCC4DRAFT_33284 [Bipolaris maydis ATCC 48331]
MDIKMILSLLPSTKFGLIPHKHPFRFILSFFSQAYSTTQVKPRLARSAKTTIRHAH